MCSTVCDSRVLRRWIALPGGTVDALTLPTFKLQVSCFELQGIADTTCWTLCFLQCWHWCLLWATFLSLIAMPFFGFSCVDALLPILLGSHSHFSHFHSEKSKQINKQTGSISTGFIGQNPCGNQIYRSGLALIPAPEKNFALIPFTAPRRAWHYLLPRPPAISMSLRKHWLRLSFWSLL